MDLKHAVVVITGAASGIGRALAAAAARRGARAVVATDVAEAGVVRAAAEIGKGVVGRRLDVRDADAFAALVADVVREHGRIDLLVNNAGIGVAGEAQAGGQPDHRVFGHGVRHQERHRAQPRRAGDVEDVPLTLLHHRRVGGADAVHHAADVDVDDGVPVHAAEVLRLEGGPLGVGVSVLCPGPIDTPLIDTANPPGMPPVKTAPDIRKYLEGLAGKAYPVEKTAEEALDGVEDDRGVIVLPRMARLLWRASRFTPIVVEKVVAAALAKVRRERR